MQVSSPRPLRADAARNVERILQVARATLTAEGPEASMEEIATRAGVGIATLYRHFPNKTELLRAALGDSMTAEFAPVIARATAESDPRDGLVLLLDAAVAMSIRERHVLAAAHSSGAMTATPAPAPFFDAFEELVSRGQDLGVVRSDLRPDDLPMIMEMLLAVLWNPRPGGPGSGRRYVRLLLDAVFRTDAAALPPAEG